MAGVKIISYVNVPREMSTYEVFKFAEAAQMNRLRGVTWFPDDPLDQGSGIAVVYERQSEMQFVTEGDIYDALVAEVKE